MVHLLQDLLVDGLGDVLQLERIRRHIVNFHKHLRETTMLPFDHQGAVGAFLLRSLWRMYLVVVELAVLQTDRGGDSAHAGVGVVEAILAHAVWETLLWEGGTTT